MVPTISVMRLAELLTMHFGCTFFSFTAHTRGDSFRKNGDLQGIPVVNAHYKNIRKVASVNVMTDFNYAKRIEKVRAAEGLEMREIGKSRAGMVHIPNTPLVRSQNGHVCLWAEVRSTKPGATQYFDATTGDEINADYLTPFKAPRTTEIAYVTYGLENIKTITINGDTYNVDSTTYPEAESLILASLETASEPATV